MPENVVVAPAAAPTPAPAPAVEGMPSDAPSEPVGTPAATQEPATDAPPAVEPPKPAPVEPRARLFAEEARQEAAYRKKEMALKKDREALEAERASIREERELAQLAKTNLPEYLKRIGVPADKAAQMLVDSDKPPDALAEARKAREELEAYKREQAANAEKAHDAAVKARIRQFEADVTDAVTADPERWAYINADGAQAMVAQRVKDHFYQFGKALDPEKAADELEAELVAKEDRRKATKKWQARHAPKPVEPVGKNARGLSNSVTPAPGSKAADERKLTEEERVERAIRVLKEKQEKKD